MKKITLITLTGVLFLAPLSFAAKVQEQKLVPLKYEQKIVKSQNATTKSRKKTTAPQAANASVSYDCSVQVDPVVDKRTNKVTLGATWSEPLLPADLGSWLEAVRTVELVNKTSDWKGSKQLTIKPSLIRLYAYAESMNIHGVIALKVEYWLDNQLVESKSYRGMGSKANMMNALGEYATALNYAVHEVAPDLLQDTKRLCTK